MAVCPKCQKQRVWCDLWDKSYSLGCAYENSPPAGTETTGTKDITSEPDRSKADVIQKLRKNLLNTPNEKAAQSPRPLDSSSNGGLKTYDPVNHPRHYTQHPSGVECIQITEHFNFNLGNAIKYIWRAGERDNRLEDLRKAQWYLNREVERLSK